MLAIDEEKIIKGFYKMVSSVIVTEGQKASLVRVL